MYGLGENIFLMIMTEENFKNFTTKPIADAKKNVAGLFSLSMNNSDEVNTMMKNGIKAGGIEPVPMQDYGFMQQRTIEDFDGHTWEIFYMDISKFPPRKLILNQ